MSQLKRNRKSQQAEIDMTPMLDIVFIMLIFFIVTTSFVKESGIEITPPQAQTSQKQDNATIFVAINAEGDVWIDNRLIDIRSVRTVVARLHAENPEGSVVIQSDENARTRELISVMDQIRMAGIEKVAIAAQLPGQASTG